MEIYNRKAIFAELKDYDVLSSDNAYIEITEWHNGEGVVFDKGPLIEALMASCSVPVVFPPVLINGKHYVDGGVVKNLPVSHIRNDCKKVVAIGLHPEKEKKYSKNMRYIAERCLWFMFNANSYMDKDLADVVIEDHEMAEYTAYDLKYKNEMFRLGYDSPSRDKWCPCL